MAFVSYITYEEYKELGGTVSVDAFPILELKAQRWIDYFTFNRIPLLETIPDEVKEVLTEYIERLNLLNNQRESGDVITSYSNGVETFNYQLKSEEQTKKEFAMLATTWLPNYLTNRSVNFNVSKYLQSENNDS